MRTILFPYILQDLIDEQLLQNSRKYFFYLSNYSSTKYSFVPIFCVFLQNLKSIEKKVNPILTTDMDPDREQKFILLIHVDRKTLILQSM